LQGKDQKDAVDEDCKGKGRKPAPARILARNIEEDLEEEAQPIFHHSRGMTWGAAAWWRIVEFGK
jgi:hypothetical protein